MDSSINHFYLPDAMCLVTEERYQSFFKGETYWHIKEGFKLSDGRVVVDDRVKTPSELVREGKYDCRKNVLLSNVIHNPLLFL